MYGCTLEACVIYFKLRLQARAGAAAWEAAPPGGWPWAPGYNVMYNVMALYTRVLLDSKI